MFASYQSPRVALGFAAASLVLIPTVALAIQPPDHLRGREALELASPRVLADSGAGSWDPPATGVRSRALAQFEADFGSVWARFDRNTGALDTLIPHGLDVDGAIADAGRAEVFARGLLATHGELFAPGIDPADLLLVADVADGDTRTLGFAQTIRGVPILNAQISFRFAADRLSLVRAQLVPSPALPIRTASVEQETSLARAQRWIADDFATGDVARTDARPAAALEVLALSHVGGRIELIEVLAIEVWLTDPIGRWQVYVDAATGEPVARRSTLMWANLNFDVPQRSPVGPRTQLPARFLDLTVGGADQTTDADGTFTVALPNSAGEFAVSGSFLQVDNDAGPNASLATMVSNDSFVVWGDANDELLDAQLSAAIHAQLVKDRVRQIAPNFAYLDQQLPITVNIEDVCNAFSTGDSINFFLSGGGCENSARAADVVYHEYGHSVHSQGLIPGVGVFDGAVSEGTSDYLSATIVDDGQVGVGFFGTDEPIRDLDPDGYEWHWPEDKGEVHDEGRIIGGTLWDLRKALVDQHGPGLGVSKTDHIWFESIRRATDMPSMYLEALAANDDDGNLANGTPDGCVITDVFAAHGLFDPPFGGTELQLQDGPDGSITVTLTVGEGFADCPPDVQPTLRWRLRVPNGAPPNPTEFVALQVDGQGSWHATIPAQPEFSVVQYQVEVDWGNGTVGITPDNLADPWAEHFVGTPTEIWCSGFEDPDADGWIADGFNFGVPAGSSGDPDGAFIGNSVAGNMLDVPGTYPPGELARLDSPIVDVSGHERVRIQYRRWLNVEDGFFDRADILANGIPAWQNFASPTEIATTHHRDGEWRFHDIDVTDLVVDGQLSVSFGLASDGGLEFGGWNVDDFCIVGHGAVEGSCGNLVIDSGEECDDGNNVDGDGCNFNCYFEYPPEDGETDESGGGDETGELGIWAPDGRGCDCSTGDEKRGSGWLGLACFALLGIRRRR